MQNETGRSLVEMLGVLAIIGVLSVGGIAGFKNAMEKNRANTIISEAQKRAVVVSGQLGFNNGTPSLVDFSAYNAISGGTFGDVVTTGLTGQFGIPVSGVSQKVCQNILNTIGNNTAIRRLSSLSTPRTPMNNCEDENSFLIIYNNNLQGVENDVQYCSTHADCNQENECMVCDMETNMCKNECERVEYLESTGIQYINTNWIPNSNGKIELFGAYTEVGSSHYSEGYYLLAQHGGTNARFNIGQYVNTFSNFGFDITSINRQTDYLLDINKHTFGINARTKQMFIDDIVYENPSAADFGSTTYPLYMFARNNLNRVDFFSKARVYYCKIWDIGILVRDFVPVLSPETSQYAGQPCMFDKVSQKLFCNAGSGTFKTNLDE